MSRHGRTGDSLERYSRVTDGPLLFLAAAMIPLLLVPLLSSLPPDWETTLLAIDYFIWAVFAVDYVVRLYLSPRRLAFVRSHIPDLVIVVVPFLRPLRILRSARLLRLLRLARLAAFLTRFISEIRAVLRSRGLNYVLLVGVALVFLSAVSMVEFERGVEASNIEGFADALWWAATTVTTVGYGDRFPVSPAGRGVAVFLMTLGIALFGVLTATVAAYFVENDAGSQGSQKLLEDISLRLKSIEDRLDRFDYVDGISTANATEDLEHS